jgi:hypothetical protein
MDYGYGYGLLSLLSFIGLWFVYGFMVVRHLLVL